VPENGQRRSFAEHKEDYFLVEQFQLARFDGKRWVLFGEVIGHEEPRHRRAMVWYETRRPLVDTTAFVTCVSSGQPSPVAIAAPLRCEHFAVCGGVLPPAGI